MKHLCSHLCFAGVCSTTNGFASAWHVLVEQAVCSQVFRRSVLKSLCCHKLFVVCVVFVAFSQVLVEQHVFSNVFRIWLMNNMCFHKFVGRRERYVGFHCEIRIAR